MTEILQPKASGDGDLPEILPILPLFDAALFPKMVLPLVVTQKDSIQLVDDAMSKDRIIGLIVTKEMEESKEKPEAKLFKYGSAGMILKMAKTEDNKAQLLVQGLSRFMVESYTQTSPYLNAKARYLKDEGEVDTEVQALMSNVTTWFEKIVELSPGLPPEMGSMAKTIQEPGVLADMVASIINSSKEEKQSIIEIIDVRKRLKEVSKLLNQQLEILELGNKIQSQVKGDMDKRQREYFLREQLKAIQEELGEKDETTVQIEEYRAKIEEKNLPEDAHKEATRELDRLARMHPSSAEYTVALTYLDWITSLPWHDSTKDNLDINAVRKVLDQDHYGLEKAKKRIIEYLAVRKLKPESKGPILCFFGPPGTGKTSLGRSIARAMGRKFFRISLGGLRDEPEIRGHRRTYVGAMPGRIIQGIRRCESNNPVYMLDEIDKVGSDFRGDPSSALLEVLDPEQNNTFSDNYLDVAFDLSKVMFITTANVLDTIPPALRDRMEVIEMVGYTLDEKINIANKYLIPRQREAHGINAKQISFTKGALKQIIAGYTREAGLRNLEREIATICRGVATKIVADEAKGIKITIDHIPEYLGPVKIRPDVAERTSFPGVATGLAWTPYGGEILFIEATAMKGKKGLTLTGQLGEVMKESAMTALSFIRSKAKALKIDEDFFDEHDLHVHIPAGAIPKDGPSAGVTLMTALVSLLKDKKIKKNLAMTGEITLRGQVLPVGGVKEKVLAAHRAGIKTVVLPKWNEKDLQDVPEKVKKDIQFHFEDKMMDVLHIALGIKPT